MLLTSLNRLVSKAKVESLIALIGSCAQIILLVFFTHRVPFGCTLSVFRQKDVISMISDHSLVDSNIEYLGGEEKHKVIAGDGDQNFVTSVVIRLILCPVDIAADDV